MRHHQSGRKLNRKRGGRQALLATLAVSLIRDEKIKTTEAKAKELKPLIERLVTYGKRANLASTRLISSKVGALPAKKMTEVIAPRYKERAGGYTRILKLGVRKSDATPEAIIEFV